MTTNVPPLQFTAAGAVAPAESAVLTGVQTDINTAFGGNLNPALSTPQGQLATTIAALIAQCNADFVNLVTQMDPAYATGRYQDGIGRIYMLTRNPAVPTSVTCTLVGIAGTFIPANSQAIDTSGNIYLSTVNATIPAGGSINVVFNAQIPGPIACLAGSLNRIYRAISGWDSITNAADGVIGSNVESRYAFETRRQQSVAKNSMGMLASILGSVLAVIGVTDAYATENDSAGSIVITGVTLVANSIYICTYGGNSNDIAMAIMEKKMPGCNMNGTTSVVVQDTNPIFVTPYPTYTIKFQIATPLTIYFAVNIANNIGIPSDAAIQIQNAIIAAFSGSDGGSRARIGSTIFASRYYSAIASLGAWAEILSVFVATTAAPTSGNSVLVPINQIPVTAAADITVTLV